MPSYFVLRSDLVESNPDGDKGVERMVSANYCEELVVGVEVKKVKKNQDLLLRYFSPDLLALVNQ